MQVTNEYSEKPREPLPLYKNVDMPNYGQEHFLRIRSKYTSNIQSPPPSFPLTFFSLMSFTRLRRRANEHPVPVLGALQKVLHRGEAIRANRLPAPASE